MANVRWVMGKAREFQKSVYCCFVDYAQAFACVDHGKLWTILREMGENLYGPPHTVSVPNTGMLRGLGGDIMGHGAITGSQVPSEQSATTFRD